MDFALKKRRDCGLKRKINGFADFENTSDRVSAASLSRIEDSACQEVRIADPRGGSETNFGLFFPKLDFNVIPLRFFLQEHQVAKTSTLHCNKTAGDRRILAKKLHGSGDLHTPIHPLVLQLTMITVDKLQ